MSENTILVRHLYQLAHRWQYISEWRWMQQHRNFCSRMTVMIPVLWSPDQVCFRSSELDPSQWGGLLPLKPRYTCSSTNTCTYLWFTPHEQSWEAAEFHSYTRRLPCAPEAGAWYVCMCGINFIFRAFVRSMIRGIPLRTRFNSEKFDFLPARTQWNKPRCNNLMSFA